MKRKFLFVLCISLLTVSCNPTNTGNTPDKVEPPVIKNRLSSVMITENGGLQKGIFGATYEDGHIKRIKVSEWAFGRIFDISEPIKGKPDEVELYKVSNIIERVSKAFVSDWTFDLDILYEENAIYLNSREGNEKLVLAFNDDKSIRTVIYPQIRESDCAIGLLNIMNLFYNADGQLLYYIFFQFESSDSTLLKSTGKALLSFEYTNGSVSSLSVEIMDANDITDKFIIKFEDITEKNTYGIVHPFFDPTGMLNLFGTLDIIGNKNVYLPKNGSMKILILDGEHVADDTELLMDFVFNYVTSEDGYVENIRCTINKNIPTEVVEETTFDFAYEYDK